MRCAEQCFAPFRHSGHFEGARDCVSPQQRRSLGSLCSTAISRRKVILMRKIALFPAALTALVLYCRKWTGVRTYPISALAGSTVHASAMTSAKGRPTSHYDDYSLVFY